MLHRSSRSLEYIAPMLGQSWSPGLGKPWPCWVSVPTHSHSKQNYHPPANLSPITQESRTEQRFLWGEQLRYTYWEFESFLKQLLKALSCLSGCFSLGAQNYWYNTHNLYDRREMLWFCLSMASSPFKQLREQEACRPPISPLKLLGSICQSQHLINSVVR